VSHRVTRQKKAPPCGAFFVFLSFTLGLSSLASPLWADRCPAPTGAERVTVRRVIDGDTLTLNGGEVIRLIGIDTPELGRDGNPDRPYAREARTALVRLVAETQGEMLLQRGADAKDRYHRTLAHLFTLGGESLTAELLRQGLGYQAIMAPNLAHLDCYRAAEQEAREAGRALWSEPVRDAREVGREETGFHILRGRVERVTTSRQAVWLSLVGGVRVKIPWSVWTGMREGDLADLEGRELEVRGWFYRREQGLRVAISHPAAVRWR